MTVGIDGQVHARAVARPESIAPLRHAVVEYAARCGASTRQRQDIAVAVSEAVTNAVLHGYAGHDEPGLVAVQAWLTEGSLQVVVSDEGIGMRPRFRSAKRGVGLSLIARMTQQARFEDATPGLRVRMTFAIS